MINNGADMTSIQLLAIETATEHCSVALLHQDKITTQALQSKNQHAAEILGMIEAILQQTHLVLSDSDAIAFGCGPGSFTGVRIAVSITQGLAYGISKPVIPISTLQIMAQQAYIQYQVRHALVALDARMQQIYSGLYSVDENGLMQPYGDLMLLAPEEFLSRARLLIDAQKMALSDWCGVGNGWQIYSEALQNEQLIPAQVYPDVVPLASAALPLAFAAYQQGALIHAEQAEPIYLRDDVARKAMK